MRFDLYPDLYHNCVFTFIFSETGLKVLFCYSASETIKFIARFYESSIFRPWPNDQTLLVKHLRFALRAILDRFGYVAKYSLALFLKTSKAFFLEQA